MNQNIKIKVNNSIHQSYDTHSSEVSVEVKSKKKTSFQYNYKDKFAYSPLINTHDRLIDTWFPRAGEWMPYTNIHIWLQELDQTTPFIERNKIWQYDMSLDLTKGNALEICRIGMYKNILSGVHILQDHIKPQKPEYYDSFDIHVIRDYVHSSSILPEHNTDDRTPEEIMLKSKSLVPFVIMLASGVDRTSKRDITILKEKNLLQANTLIVNGVSLTEKDFQEIEDARSSICWSPSSNMNLVGETLNVLKALEAGVNITLGSDSTLAGGHILFDEFRYAKRLYPELSSKQLYSMVTKNAELALLLYDDSLLSHTKNLLILDKCHDDIYDNLLYQDLDTVDLLIHQSKPIYGNVEYYDDLGLDESEYEIVKIGDKEKFIIGSPTKLADSIAEKLGTRKTFPFFPF
jgi:hypothetical protein